MGENQPKMGCTSSQDQKGGAKKMNIRVTATEKAKVDPKDFEFVDCKGQLLVKPAGSINGLGPITITKCEDCDIYLFDWSAAVNIYECVNCRIFVGPVDGSVQFVENVDCSLVVACQQFRPTDCKNCNILLMATGEPGMVTCQGMKYGCFQFSYPELKDHFGMSGLNVHNNKWSRVHDFASQDGKKSTWEFLDSADNDPFGSGMLARPSEMDAAQFGAQAENELSYQSVPIVPLTHGRRAPWSEEGMAFVVFQTQDAASSFYTSAVKHSVLIAETLCHQLTKEQAKDWIAGANPGKMVGVLLAANSDEESQQLQKALDSMDSSSYSLVSGAEAATKVRVWFEQLGADAGAHLH